MLVGMRITRVVILALTIIALVSACSEEQAAETHTATLGARIVEACGHPPDTATEAQVFAPAYSQWPDGTSVVMFSIFAYVRHVVYMEQVDNWSGCVTTLD